MTTCEKAYTVTQNILYERSLKISWFTKGSFYGYLLRRLYMENTFYAWSYEIQGETPTEKRVKVF